MKVVAGQIPAGARPASQASLEHDATGETSDPELETIGLRQADLANTLELRFTKWQKHDFLIERSAIKESWIQNVASRDSGKITHFLRRGR